ncbi:MAG TPA: hypothetical protein VG125_29805 [Pirellulales bacterium]|jgi:hypothetical protein|nr:hypothetical protein [Pirellulales bacterium]
MVEPANHDQLPREKNARHWQFGLSALLGTLMILCVPFALWGAVLRANQADQSWLMALCMAAPLGVMILVSLAASAGRFLRKRRRKPAVARADDDTWP